MIFVISHGNKIFLTTQLSISLLLNFLPVQFTFFHLIFSKYSSVVWSYPIHLRKEKL